MIIKNAEKAFDKFQHPLLIQVLRKLRQQNFNLIEDLYNIQL